MSLEGFYIHSALGFQKRLRMPATEDKDGCKLAHVCWKWKPGLYKSSECSSLLRHVFTLISTESFQAKLASPRGLMKAKLRPTEGTV